MSVTLDGTNGLILDTGGQPIQNVSTINSGYLYGNRVINGAQEIDQLNNGAAVTPATSPAYLTDMFGSFLSQASKLTFQQVADAPAGLKNSLKVTVAAQYAPAATDAFTLLTAIEGKDVIDFQMGTSGAATFTISNWIKGSVAGTYSVALKNAALNRSYVGVISVTTSWAPVKITVTGDLTGTWATDNTVGLYIQWDLGSGSNYNTTAGAWGAGDLRRTSGSVTFVNQVAGSTLNITGVDCRLGSVAPTVFERRANELQLAQRYFQIIYGGQLAGQASGANAVILVACLPVTLRTNATNFTLLKTSYAAASFEVMMAGNWVTNASASLAGPSAFAQNFVTTMNGFSGLSLGQAVTFNLIATPIVSVSARLF
jgi:hypothetical protein